MTSANFREIGSGLAAAFHLSTRPLAVYGTDAIPAGIPPMAGINRCFAVSLYRMAAGREIPGIYIGAGATEGCCPGGLFHTGYIPVPDDIKYFVSTGRKDVRGGAAEFLKASPDLVDRCSAAAGPIHPPGKYLVVQACESLPDPMPNVLSLCIFGNGEQIRNMAALIHLPGRAVLSGHRPVGLCLFDLYHLPGGPCGEHPEKHRVHGPAGPHAEPFAPTGNDGSRDPRGDGQADGRKPRCIVYHPAASGGLPPPRGAAGPVSGPFFSSVKIREQIVRTLLGATALPAFAPAACGIPRLAIVLYYLHRKDGKTDVSCAGATKASLTPPPPLGAGLA